MRTKKWDTLAARIADFLAAELSAAPRGRIDLDELGCVALFGNDGYATDPRVRREVELIRKGLPAIGLDVLGFGLSDGGRSWAMILDIEAGDTAGLFEVPDLIWSSWVAAVAEASGRRPRMPWRRAIAADGAIAEAPFSPDWAARLEAWGLVALAEAVWRAPGPRPRPPATTTDREEAGRSAGGSETPIGPAVSGWDDPGMVPPPGDPADPDCAPAGAGAGTIRLFIAR